MNKKEVIELFNQTKRHRKSKKKKPNLFEALPQRRCKSCGRGRWRPDHMPFK